MRRGILMKMEIKVRCGCGSLFSFDDTPVDGCLTLPISCTNCGTDCTGKANDYIQRKHMEASGQAPKTEPKKGLFGFKKKRDAVADLDREFAEAAVVKEETVSATGDETSERRLVLAGSAALITGCLGAVGWLYVAKVTGYQIGYVAWGLGALVGWSSRLVAPRGHHLLGLVATVAAMIAIMGGQYLVSRWLIHDEVDRFVPEAYEAAAVLAKDAAAAKTDEGLRTAAARFKLVDATVGDLHPDAVVTYQNYQVADSGFVFGHIAQHEARQKLMFEEMLELDDEDNVTPAEMASFKARVLPALKQFAGGRPDRAAYEAGVREELVSRITFKGTVINSLTAYTFLWVFLGLGSSYKIARNRGLELD